MDQNPIIDGITRLHKDAMTLIESITSMQESLISKYNQEHSPLEFYGFVDEKSPDTVMICTLDCVLAHVRDVVRNLDHASELLSE